MARVLSERQVANQIYKFIGSACEGDKLEVVQAFADRDFLLMGKDHAREALPRALAPGGFSQQVVIIGEEHAAQLDGSIHNDRIGGAVQAVFLHREHVHAACAQTPADRSSGVFIEV